MAYSFDGPNKLITLSAGTVSVSVRDLWSRWGDWWLTGDNSKYLRAMDVVGGNDIDPGEGTAIPIYCFLQNGWKIKPQEADHTLNVGDGILLVDGGGDPFVDTTGSYVVRINFQQPVQAITVSTSGATVDWDDLLDGTSIESGMTLRQAMRLMSAALGGKMSGSPGGPVNARAAVSDAKTRITYTVDGQGNRTAVATDLD